VTSTLLAPPASPGTQNPETPSEAGAGAADRVEVGFGVIFAVVAAWSWVGLTLAEAGWYAPATLVTGAGAASFVAGRWIWRALHREPARPSRRAGGPWLALWLALATALFTPPGEYLVNGGDGSVYLNIGRALGRHGGLAFSDPLLEHVDRTEWPALFHTVRTWPHLLDRFPGGVQLEPDSNVVRPNFFHLLPVWIANLELLAGPSGAYGAAPLFGVLSVAALWLFARASCSLLTANLAVVFLAVSFAQVWFARYPGSEIVAQFFILAGLYFAAAWTERPAAVTGACAGVAFGLAAFARIDVLLLVSPVVAVFLALTRSRREAGWRPMAAAFALLTLQALAHALIVSGPYTLRVLHFAFTSRWATWSGVLLAPAVLAFGILAILGRRRQSGPRLRQAATGLLVVVAAAAAIRLAPGLAWGYPAMLLSPVGVTLAIVGTFMLLRLAPPRPTLLAIGLLATSTLVYVDSVRDLNGMPVVFRRFVPVILPIALFAGSHALTRIWLRGGRTRWAAPALAALLLAGFAGQTAPLVASPPMQDVHERVRGLAGLLPADAVIVVDSSTPSHLGLSLHYTFGREVLHVTSGPGTAAVLGNLAASLSRDGRRLVLAVGRDRSVQRALGSDDLARLGLAAAGTFVLERRELESTIDRFPSDVHTLTTVIDVYNATPRQAAMLPVELDVGGLDLGVAHDGFHDGEVMGPVTARWTKATAAVVLPQVNDVERAALILRLAAPRPEGLPPVQVSLALDGEPLGATQALTPGFAHVEVPLGAAALQRLTRAPAVLTLRTPVFVPVEYGFGGDTRELGAAVDWIRLEPR
ncbi:MAG TPA: hypothetical protein VF136_08600, partial [Methylomirabilota bacterium]